MKCDLTHGCLDENNCHVVHRVLLEPFNLDKYRANSLLLIHATVFRLLLPATNQSDAALSLKKMLFTKRLKYVSNF